jgi:hypothetical protein
MTGETKMKPCKWLLAIAVATAVSACAKTPSNTAPITKSDNRVPAAANGAVVPLVPDALPIAVVHKSPSCGCCGLWIEHLQQSGFRVEVRNEDNLDPVKSRLGIPFGKGSCHTAEIGGYFVEGHVPANDIKRLLAEQPDAKGLVLPGMPMGSPGMEVPAGNVQPYTVELVQRDGTTVAYASHDQ